MFLEFMNAVATIIGTTIQVAQAVGKAVRKNSPTDLFKANVESKIVFGLVWFGLVKNAPRVGLC